MTNFIKAFGFRLGLIFYLLSILITKIFASNETYQSISFDSSILSFWSMFINILLPFFGLCLASYIMKEINEVLITFGLMCPLFYLAIGNVLFLYMGLGAVVVGVIIRYVRI